MILLFEPSNSPIFILFLLCVYRYAHVYNPLIHSWFTVLQVCQGDLLLESPQTPHLHFQSLPIPDSSTRLSQLLTDVLIRSFCKCRRNGFMYVESAVSH